jgi:hypothetical protein
MSQSTESRSAAPALLFAAGGLLVAAAVGVAALGALGQAALASSLAAAGVTPGLLGVGGLCLLGVGVAARVSASRAGDTRTSAELEALAREIAGLREQFDEVRQQQAQILAIGQAGGQFGLKPVAEQTNAIFRIAASLDQLGAKLDSGFKTQFASVDEKLNILARVLAGLRDSVQSANAAANVASGSNASAGSAAAAAPNAAPVQPAASAPRTAPVPATAQPPRSPLPARPAAPTATSLGILDQLGDHSTPPAPAAAPAARAQAAVDPAAANEPLLIDLSSEESAKAAQEPAQHAAQKPAAKSGSNLDALLPDDSVRRALGS